MLIPKFNLAELHEKKNRLDRDHNQKPCFRQRGSFELFATATSMSYPKLKASFCARYASGEANGDGAERFYSGRLQRAQMAMSPYVSNWKVIHHFATKIEHELGNGADLSSAEVVGISATRSSDSNTLELDNGWKLFSSGVEPAKFAQAGVSILVSPQLASCVDEWVPPGGRVCMLRLKLLDRFI